MKGWGLLGWDFGRENVLTSLLRLECEIWGEFEVAIILDNLWYVFGNYQLNLKFFKFTKSQQTTNMLNKLEKCVNTG